MRKPAKVRFIGNSDYYKLGCERVEWVYCRDCEKKKCNISTPVNFIKDKIYNAYFLEYWQGERDSLHIKGENGKIKSYFPLSDFEIVEDTDGVLNKKEAVVRCVVSVECDSTGHIGITCGKEYKAIGYKFDKKGDLLYLVMDNSSDCYFYLPSKFEIISDENEVLNPQKTPPVYDFSDFEE